MNHDLKLSFSNKLVKNQGFVEKYNESHTNLIRKISITNEC